MTDAEYVFPAQRAVIKAPTKRAGLSIQFARLCEQLEVEGKSFHSLRHYFSCKKYNKLDKEALTKKLAGSLSLEEIAVLLGHQKRL